MISRLAYFDVARALCMLWVVGFWHAMGYWTSPYDRIEGSDLGQIITWGILAGFTFFSGYFLRHKTVNTLDDIKSFYKARFFKFYILYAISCLTLYFAGIILSASGKGQIWFSSPSSLVYSLIGLGTYLGVAPATLWYMTMLMSFYFITPVFLFLNQKHRFYFIVLLNSFLLLATSIFEIDVRNIMYFPFYCFGLFSLDFNKLVEKHLPAKTLGCLFLFGISAVIQLHTSSQFNNWFYSSCFFFILSIILVSRIIETWLPQVVSLLVKVSYGSMAAFLFHRQVYGVLKILLKDSGISPVTTSLIFLPTIFILSFYVQQGYDFIINKLIR